MQKYIFTYKIIYKYHIYKNIIYIYAMGLIAD